MREATEAAAAVRLLVPDTGKVVEATTAIR
jgi:hypothetical protein